MKTLGFDRFYVRGEGCYLYDRSGERYLDFFSGFGVFALGAQPSRGQEGIHDAAELTSRTSCNWTRRCCPGLLAESLVGGRTRASGGCSSCNSGIRGRTRRRSSSPDTSTSRPRILHCDHAFHGLSPRLLSLNGGKEFRVGFGPLLPG